MESVVPWKPKSEESPKDSDSFILPRLSRPKKCFDCKYCSKGFLTKTECQHHMSLHFRERKFKCVLCKKTFLKQAHLREHARIHSGERPFQCNLCTQDFITTGALFAHKLSYHPESLFYCSGCGRKFQKQTSLDLHKCTPRKKVVRAGPLVGSKASKRQKSSQKTSVRSQRGRKGDDGSLVFTTKHLPSGVDKPYKCNICDRRFFTPNSVVRHKSIVHFRFKSSQAKVSPRKRKLSAGRSNTKFAKSKFKKGSKYKSIPSGHKCPTCGMGFRVPSVLKRHMKTHTGEDTYSCHICGKKIRRFDGLQSHMRQHTGNAIHSCKLCDKSFDAIVRLKRHMKTTHGKTTHSFTRCKLCSKTFLHDDDLQRHMKIGIHAMKDQNLQEEMDEEEEDDEKDEEDEEASVMIEINTDPGFLDDSDVNDEFRDGTETSTTEHPVRGHASSPDVASPVVKMESEEVLHENDDPPDQGNEEGKNYAESEPDEVTSIKQEVDADVGLVSDVGAMNASLKGGEQSKSADGDGEGSFSTAAVGKCTTGSSSASPGKLSDEAEDEVDSRHVESSDAPSLLIEPANSEAEEGASFWIDYTYTGTKKGTRYVCKFCDKRFRDITQARDHSWVHTGVKRHKCTLCGKEFTASCSLKVHLKNVHSELDTPDGRYVLKRDDSSPSVSPKPSLSPIASSSSVFGTSLVTRRQSRELSKQAAKETKVEITASPPKAPPQVHRSYSPKGHRIQCRECPKTFIDMTHLRNHMWVHTGIKLHKCVVCGKDFSTSGSLNVHKRMAHTEDQIVMAENAIELEAISSFDDPLDYVSNRLTSSSQSPRDLKFPIRSREGFEGFEEGDDEDDEDDCFQVLAAEEERVETGDEFAVEMESTEFVSFHRNSAEDNWIDSFNMASNFNSGYQSEDSYLSRDDANQSEADQFTVKKRLSTGSDDTDSALQGGQAAGRKNRIKCPNCDKTFCDKANLRNHMWVHTGVKLHKCHICTKAFTTSSSLHVHMRRSHAAFQVTDPLTGEVSYQAPSSQIPRIAQEDSTLQVAPVELRDSLHAASSDFMYHPTVGGVGAGADSSMEKLRACDQSALTHSLLDGAEGGSMDSNDGEDSDEPPGLEIDLSRDMRLPFSSDPPDADAAVRPDSASRQKVTTGSGRKQRIRGVRGHPRDLPAGRKSSQGVPSYNRQSSWETVSQRGGPGKQRISCTRCQKTFSTTSHYRNHMWVHTGIKLHHCQICDKEFTTANSVKVHMRAMHSQSDVQRAANAKTPSYSSQSWEYRSNLSFLDSKEAAALAVDGDVENDSASNHDIGIALSEDECEVEGVIDLDEEHVEGDFPVVSDEATTESSNPGQLKFMQIVNPSLSDEEDREHTKPMSSVRSKWNNNWEVNIKQEVLESPEESLQDPSEKEPTLQDSFSLENSKSSAERDSSEKKDGNLTQDQGSPTNVRSGRKRIPCSLCKKTFCDKFHLSNHMWVHTGEKRHKCHICRSRYTVSSSLFHHMRKAHGLKNAASNSSKDKVVESNGNVTSSPPRGKLSSSAREFDKVTNQNVKGGTVTQEEDDDDTSKTAKDENMHDCETDYQNNSSPYLSDELRENASGDAEIASDPETSRNCQSSFSKGSSGSVQLKDVTSSECLEDDLNLKTVHSRGTLPRKSERISQCISVPNSGRQQTAGRLGGSASSYAYMYKRNKRFKCSHCPKEFINSTDCQDHTWVHTGVKRHQCSACRLRFVSNGSLKIHFQKFHREVESDFLGNEEVPSSNEDRNDEENFEGDFSQTSSTFRSRQVGPLRRKPGPKSARIRLRFSPKNLPGESEHPGHLDVERKATRRIFSACPVGKSANITRTEGKSDAPTDDQPVDLERGGPSSAVMTAPEGNNASLSFDCFICSQSFDSLEDLDTHMFSHSP